MTQARNWLIIGSELSPYTLKLELMCRYAGLPYKVLPDSGSAYENALNLIRKERLIRGQLPLTWPQKTALDEYPLVPFLFGPKGENLYDSSAIGEWLDTQAPLPGNHSKLIPQHPLDAFLTHLLDEFADEFVLYLVHHQRWCFSAKDNNAGDRLAKELRSLLGPGQAFYSRWFSRRQVNRMPYLFSVAERGFSITGLKGDRQPPARAGFPATHHLLETCYLELIDHLNTILDQRNTLVTSSFTLADASIYGQLAMNLTDPSTRKQLNTNGPALCSWLEELRLHTPSPSPPPSAPESNLKHLKPLLKTICETYIPLMHQNYNAYKAYKAKKETLFNEKAFWKNRALFDGTIRNTPYRAVVKTFQVKSWLALRSKWEALPDNDKFILNKYLPLNHGLDKDG